MATTPEALALAEQLGAVTVSYARDERRASDIAVITGLGERAVLARLEAAHGNALVRKLFEGDWPSASPSGDAGDLGFERLADDAAAQLLAAAHGGAPLHEAWPVDSREHLLLKRVPEDGTAIGNTTLMRELGWPEAEYRDVRNHLLDRDQIELGRGRGGSVRRVLRKPLTAAAVGHQDASVPVSRAAAPSTGTGPSHEKAVMTDESAPNDNDDTVVEGLDDAEPAGLGEYPIDSLMIRNETRTVHEVLRRIEKEQFILDPDFQRAFVWNEERQSRLIESVVLRIPLPVMYLAENQDGKLVVVDGLQRLTTFQRYASNQFALQLDNAVLAGRRFLDLDMRLQNRIEDTQLILYVIDAKVPERVRLESPRKSRRPFQLNPTTMAGFCCLS